MNNDVNKYNDAPFEIKQEIQQTIGENSDAPFEIKQEIQQTIGGNVNEIENFKNFIKDYEESIKETLFKNLDDVKYTNRYSKKIVSEYKDRIIILLNNIKEMGINRLKNADVINIKNLLMEIKNEKIFKIYENITKYKNRHFFIYEKTDQYIIDNMKELCEDFKSVLDYYENPSKFKKEEAKRKVREEYEKKFSEKNSEKNKEKKPLNSITNSAEEEKLKKEKFEEDLERKTTNGFMLRPKYLKEGLQLTDPYKKYLKKFKNEETKNAEDDKISLIENKMSSNLVGLLYTFKDKFYAEREKRGKNIDATYLKNNFKTKYETLIESIRVKLEELRDLLKRCEIKINEPSIFTYAENYEIKRFLLGDVIKHIKKVKIEFFTRNKTLIDSEISSLFSRNNVHEYTIIRKQYEKILYNLEREKKYLERLNEYLKKYEETGRLSYFTYDCYKYIDNKLKQIANIYARAINDDNAEEKYKDDSVDYRVYGNIDFNSDSEFDSEFDSDYEFDWGYGSD